MSGFLFRLRKYFTVGLRALLGLVFLVDSFLSLSALNMSPHYPLDAVISAEKSALNLTDVPWSAMTSFSLALSRFPPCL